MDPDVRIWLKDIELSIKEIHDFLSSIGSYSDFQNDLKTRKAVERNIEIIGEAMNRIREVEPDIHITDSRKIADTRNRIIHGYDSVSPDIIWLIIKRDLSVLEQEVHKLLQ
ncbi:MAG: HepT-like ribonuclease domain-containing protein [Bacteroidales bacterium]